ncbi:MAG: hypothetical protein ACR2K5_12310 [Pseudolabrys sp.]
MKFISSAAIFLVTASVFALPAAPSYAATMKECAAQWDKMKAAKQTEGKKYREFSKECMSGASATPAAAPATAPAPAATAKPATAPAPATAAQPAPEAAPATAAKPAPAQAPTKTAAPATGGRAGEIARERACAADWKADKAANKTAGMKWPQYWSACDKRKKAAGM